MRIVEIKALVQQGGVETDPLWALCLTHIREAITSIVWPPGNATGQFVIRPESGKKSGMGSGVGPIKDAFLKHLAGKGWGTRDRQNPHLFDAIYREDDGPYVAVEWETGNISSSHRSMSRFSLAHLDGELEAAALVLPTQRLARFLTDRVGNYEELSRYFPVWERLPWDRGLLTIIAVEHDAEDVAAPRIPKGTDGRALL